MEEEKEKQMNLERERERGEGERRAENKGVRRAAPNEKNHVLCVHKHD